MAHHYRWLIIDDEEDILTTYSNHFRKRGFQVDTVNNGQAGLDKLCAEEYDVALVDLRMPGELDGLDVIRQAVEADASADLVVLTGHGDKQDAVNALNYGAVAWIEKSGADLNKIFDKVKRLAEGMPLEKVRTILSVLPEDA